VRVLLVTSNPGKLRDFRALTGSDVQLELLPPEVLQPNPEETGITFEENARLKASEYSRRLPREFVLADDSGLEIDALGGAPGVHSARYAGSGKGNSPDDDNNARVLREIDTIPEPQRTARFVCVLALARDGEVIATARGHVEGMILRELRGNGGFGYDPLFYVPELGVTFAQIPAERKGEYSHRGRAFRAMLRQMDEIFRREHNMK
jgi:XTP/dITP diphosphohydrolase